MGFRITTNMMMNSYRYNLQGSTKKLSDARDKVLTQRNFNSYAEDPAAATQAFRLRRTYYQSYSQLTNTKNAYSKYNTAWHNLAGIKTDLVDGSAVESAIRGENDTTGEARKALATVLREDAESVIHALNQKLGDQFIFAGNDGLNVPFEWKDVPSADGKTTTRELFYRGINVNTQVPSEKAQLEAMSKEQLYIDLGMGMAENSPNNPVNGSYFNSALCGIDFIGFGVDDKGCSNNLAMVMRELADVFDEWSEDTQMYTPEKYRNMPKDQLKEELKKESVQKEIADYNSKQLEKAYHLRDKMTGARDHLSEKWVELDAKSEFLQSNEERLTTLLNDTNTQILDVEQVDLADAITTFSWQQYCYNAALKIGNQLLSQSLIDYMN